MDICVINRQSAQKVQTGFLKKSLERLLSRLECDEKELSVLLVDDEQIRRLNRRYRDRDSATDVLAFPQQEADEPLSSPADRLLGDIVISVPTARRQARENDHTLERELIILLVHGLLHLLGYDHGTQQAAALMRRKERELLAGFQGLLARGKG